MLIPLTDDRSILLAIMVIFLGRSVSCYIIIKLVYFTVNLHVDTYIRRSEKNHFYCLHSDSVRSQNWNTVRIVHQLVMLL